MTYQDNGLRNLVLVCVGQFLAVVSQTMLLLAVPLRAIDIGASPALIGFVLSAPYLLPMLLAIPLGGRVTRHGPQRMFALGAIGMIAGPLVSLTVDSLIALLITQLIVGLAHVVMVISAQSVVATLGQGKTLERYFGWYTMFISGAQLTGPLLAGFLIDNFSMRPTFLVAAAIPTISLLASLFLTGRAGRSTTASSSAGGYTAQVHLIKKNVGVQMSILSSSAVLFAIGVHVAFLPVYLDSLTLSASLIGLLVSLRAFVAMAMRPFMISIIEYLGGRSNTFIISTVFLGSGIFFVGLTNEIWILVCLAILVGLGSGISQPLSIVALAEHVATNERSSALGMRLTVNRAAQLMTPITLGLLAEWFGFNLAFAAAGILLLCTAWLIYRLAPSFNVAESNNKQVE